MHGTDLLVLISKFNYVVSFFLYLIFFKYVTKVRLRTKAYLGVFFYFKTDSDAEKNKLLIYFSVSPTHNLLPTRSGKLEYNLVQTNFVKFINNNTFYY